MARTNFENLRVYRLSKELADAVWAIVAAWGLLARDTVGKQLVRAADSIGTNIAEGAGRGSYRDNRAFIRIARGSLNETKHWLPRAYCRGLLEKTQVEQLRKTVDALAPQLNGFLKSLGARAAAKASHAEPLTTNH